MRKPPPPPPPRKRKSAPPPPRKRKRTPPPPPPPPRKRRNRGAKQQRHKRGQFDRKIAKGQGSRRLFTWKPTGEESNWFEPEGPVRVQTMKLLNDALGVRYRRLIPNVMWDLWQIQMILEWYQNNIAYYCDPDGQDYWQEPHLTLEGKGGDCDDHALLFASMVLSIGGKARIVVSAKNSKEAHAFCEVAIGLNPTAIHKADSRSPIATDHWNQYRLKMAEERPHRAMNRQGLPLPMDTPVHYDVGDFRWVIVDPLGSAWVGDIDALQEMGYVLSDYSYPSYNGGPIYIVPKNVSDRVNR